jgi:hypothetical protein
MREGRQTAAVGGWRSCFFAVASMLLAACTPAWAHHQTVRDGPSAGVAIRAITHGEMLIVARYRARILDLAARQPRTDPTLRRLAGFVSLQYFACFWGLIPGSLTDDTSPFNECSHAYVAGARDLLVHMVAMPGDQSSAKALQVQSEAELASDPISSALCSNSNQGFDTGTIVGPDWSLLPAHPPTILTFLGLAILFGASLRGAWVVARRGTVWTSTTPAVGERVEAALR